MILVSLGRLSSEKAACQKRLKSNGGGGAVAVKNLTSRDSRPKGGGKNEEVEGRAGELRFNWTEEIENGKAERKGVPIIGKEKGVNDKLDDDFQQEEGRRGKKWNWKGTGVYWGWGGFCW